MDWVDMGLRRGSIFNLFVLLAALAFAVPAHAGDQEAVEDWLWALIERWREPPEYPGLRVDLEYNRYSTLTDAELRALRERAAAFPESSDAVQLRGEERRQRLGSDRRTISLVWGGGGRVRVFEIFPREGAAGFEHDAVLTPERMWKSSDGQADIRPFTPPPFGGYDPRLSVGGRLDYLRRLLSSGVYHAPRVQPNSVAVSAGEEPARWTATIDFSWPDWVRAVAHIRFENGAYMIDRVDRYGRDGEFLGASVFAGHAESASLGGVFPLTEDRLDKARRRFESVSIIRVSELDSGGVRAAFRPPAIGTWHDPIRGRETELDTIVDFRSDPPRITSKNPDRAESLRLLHADAHGIGGSSLGIFQVAGWVIAACGIAAMSFVIVRRGRTARSRY